MASLLTDYSLLRHNTFGFDTRARFGRFIDSEATLLGALQDPALDGLERLVIGGGSNLVLSRDFDGVALIVALRGRRLIGEDEHAWYIEAAAGENWHEFVDWSLSQGRPGLENLALIPGTVGAAPIQNIGAYGLEISERLHAVRAIDCETGQGVQFSTAECRLGYRDSFFKQAGRGHFFITAVSFRLPKPWQPVLDYAELARSMAPGVTPTPRDIFNAVVAIRQRKLPDPLLIGNAGSFFKNPLVDALAFAALREREAGLVGYPTADGRYKLAAGWLIDRCGWKGRTIGAAGVHEEQALVLVNHGGATGSQVLALGRAIADDVFKRYGVLLEMEPVVV
ncbi:MAG: UDP-N-acetylmuramate dehydrogenase [Janthinobacterium lividum]